MKQDQNEFSVVVKGPLARAMIELWNQLTPTDRQRLLTHGELLRDAGRLVGGPFDGGRLAVDIDSDDLHQGFQHAFDYKPESIAVYTVDQRGRLIFSGFERE